MTSFIRRQALLILILTSAVLSLVSAWSRSTATSSLRSFGSHSFIGTTTTVASVLSSTSAVVLNMAGGSNEPSPVRVLGVCGGIGSGKSMACKLLVSDLGCLSHIEADSIAHTVYQPGSQAIYDVVEKFGSDILLPDKPKGEEEIDRKKLGAIVFSDPSAMSSLEHIVWPHVKTEILKQIEKIREQQETNDTNKENVIILEAAVLLDAGWEDLLDGVWVVRAPHDVAVDRLVEHRSFTKEDAEKRMKAQTTRRGIGNIDEEVKSGVVTAIIDNNGGVDELKAALLEKLQDLNAWKKT